MGNSSSGKSSLALKFVEKYQFAHLDLDTIAWKAQKIPIRESLSITMAEIINFINSHQKWIIEGCYGDLLKEILPYTNLLIFLNPTIETCVNNSKKRPWESHKYDTLEEQEANFNMLELWIKDYYVRNDEFSLNNHRQLFQSFLGKKIESIKNWDDYMIKSISQLLNV